MSGVPFSMSARVVVELTWQRKVIDMSRVEEHVPLTVRLPKSIVERVSAAAQRSSRSMEEEVAWLVQDSLEGEMDIETMLARARQAYRDRYAQLGRRPPT